MNTIRRAGIVLLPTLLLTFAAGCGLMPPPASVSPSPTAEAQAPSLTTEATPMQTPMPPSASPTATPGLDLVPRFAVGAQVATNAPGLRVRSRPGTGQRVITSLGVDADLLVAIGPVLIDGLGWYQVRDADDDEPEFGEGWVAAGFEPDPFLVSAGFPVDVNPYLAGFAGSSGGEHGPVLLPSDADIGMRWIAATVSGEVCNFAVDLRRGNQDPVPAVRTPVGGFPASGELPPQFFASHTELEGDLIVAVASNCSWALSFVRTAPVEGD